MLQFLLKIARLATAPACSAEPERWRFDPLAHPALRRMSQAELGDLPIGHPAARQADCCGC